MLDLVLSEGVIQWVSETGVVLRASLIACLVDWLIHFSRGKGGLAACLNSMKITQDWLSLLDAAGTIWCFLHVLVGPGATEM